MYKSCKLYLLFIAIFGSYVVSAQSSDWIDDSLSYYSQKVNTALEKGDFDAIRAYNNLIGDQGFKSLNPKVYEYFYEQREIEAYQNHPEIYAILHSKIGILEFYRSNFTAAKIAFSQALEIYKQSKDEKNAAGMAMNLGILNEKEGKPDSAIISYKRAILIFDQIQDTSSLANCFENLAIVFSDQAEYDSAELYLNKVDSLLSLNTPKKSDRWITYYYNRGRLFETMSKHAKALESIFKGLSLSEELADNRRIFTGYSFISSVYQSLEDTTNLKKYVHKGRAFAEGIQDKSRMAQLDIDLGNLYLDQSNLDSALYYAERGLKLAKEVDFTHELRKAYVLIGNIRYRQERYDETIKNLEIVLNEYPSTHDKSLSGEYHNLGSAYMQIGNFEKSTEYLQKSLELGLKVNDWARLKEAYQTLSIKSEKQEDFKNAYEFYKLYKQYEDSIFNEIKSQQLAEVQTKYETEQKDQAIAGLKQEREIQSLQAEKQRSQINLSLAGIAIVLIVAFVFYNQSRVKQKTNKILESKNYEIAEQNSEKEILLKEIHHRVKNNLQIISSLLSMQTRTMSDLKLIDAMKESQSRVKTMALIHEKLYQYDNLARINMHEYMSQLSDFLSETYQSEKDINIVIESEGVSLDIDTAVPLGLITNELLSNALKYAFEDMREGQITIKLSKDISGSFVLTISDTGIGLADDMDIEKSKSLGLKLVRTLTRQINGVLSISSKPGATFSIVFDENKLAA